MTKVMHILFDGATVVTSGVIQNDYLHKHYCTLFARHKAKVIVTDHPMYYSRAMEDQYTASLAQKTIEELTTELQKIQDQLDILFTMNNSLDDTDITEGGGDPQVQAQYQECILHQKLINQEINKRHMLDMLQ